MSLINYFLNHIKRISILFVTMCDMKSFDTEPLTQELNSVLNIGLTKILSKYVDRYNLLEDTHVQIMNLPSVQLEMKNRSNESNTDVNEVRSQIIRAHMDTITNLRNEINELKESLSKKPVCNCNATCEKINIKLEIEDIPADEPAYVVTEEKEAEEEEEEDEEEEEEEEDEEDEEEEEEVVEEKEVVEEEEVVKEKEVVKEEEEIETENEEEEDFFEIEIDDVTYCTNNEETGIIYEVDKEGDIGKRVGYLKDGEPFFDNE